MGDSHLESEETSEKDFLTTLLLGFIVGPLGAHRFYTGHIVIGLIQLLACVGPVVSIVVMLATLGFREFYHFYPDHPSIGVIQLLSFVGSLTWVTIDMIAIAAGKYTDAKGLPLKR